jgi:rubrerythrin
MAMEVIKKLKEMVEKEEYVDPEMFKLDITTREEREESNELARILERVLEKETKYSQAYRAALKNLDDSLSLYWRRWSVQQIIENCKKRNEPIPWYVRDYVESVK